MKTEADRGTLTDAEIELLIYERGNSSSSWQSVLNDFKRAAGRRLTRAERAYITEQITKRGL